MGYHRIERKKLDMENAVVGDESKPGMRTLRLTILGLNSAILRLRYPRILRLWLSASLSESFNICGAGY